VDMHRLVVDNIQMGFPYAARSNRKDFWT